METVFCMGNCKRNVQFKSYYVVWKPPYFPPPAFPFFMFKSYYVVWKPRNFRKIQCSVLCLNRTMQYGNANVNLTAVLLFSGLNRTMQYGNLSGQAQHLHASSFKSYYVVWKPKEFPVGKTWVFRFKSYYVVWKRFLDVETKKITLLFKSYYVVWKRSLGQYQNNRNRQFKSYYVVWKPFEQLVFFDVIRVFKSYYVVWKLETWEEMENVKDV